MLRVECMLIDTEEHHLLHYGVNTTGLSKREADEAMARVTDQINNLDVVKHLKDAGIRFSVIVHPLEDSSVVQNVSDDMGYPGCEYGEDVALNDEKSIDTVTLDLVSLVSDSPHSITTNRLHEEVCSSNASWEGARIEFSGLKADGDLWEPSQFCGHKETMCAEGDIQYNTNSSEVTTGYVPLQGTSDAVAGELADIVRAGHEWDSAQINVCSTNDTPETLPWVDESSLKGLSD